MTDNPRSTPELDRREWQALWEWHRKMELMCADAAKYETAMWHKERQETIARFVAPADWWERAWSNQNA